MKRTKPAAAILACAILAASVPWYAAAQSPPPAGKQKAPPPKKKKKGDKAPPPDSASASAEPAPPPPPPPEPEPAAQSPSAPPPPVASASTTADTVAPAAPSDGSWKKTAGLIAIGGGVVFLGGTYLFYKLNVNQNDAGYHAYAMGFGPSTNTCDAAKSGQTSPFLGARSPQEVQKICSRGKTYTVLEFTSLGIGVVAVGLGIYWLATSGPPKPAKAGWSVVPRLGDATGVDFAVRF